MNLVFHGTDFQPLAVFDSFHRAFGVGQMPESVFPESPLNYQGQIREIVQYRGATPAKDPIKRTTDITKTHNLFDEDYWPSCLRENLMIRPLCRRNNMAALSHL